MSASTPREARCTPGPWAVSPEDAALIYHAGKGAPIAVATVGPSPGAFFSPYLDERAANAALIAAAPKLLEALNALAAVTWSNDKHEINKAHGQALAAIAKAEGNS